MDEVLDDVRGDVIPTAAEQEQVQASADRLIEATRRACREHGIDAEPLLVGSLAKGTWVKDRVDIDCFLLFDPSTPRETIEEAGLTVGHAVLDGRERYAEHPYVHGDWEGHEADVVPCYDVEDATEQRSAVDRTPFHNAYVVEHLDEELRDDVRYLKAFMHGVGVYGAATKTQGFSGYLAEILTIHLDGFAGVLEAARDWQPGTELDPAGHAQRDFEEPLVVVDPVDGQRNAAAAVSEANLARFARAADAFLDAPHRRFFLPPDAPTLSLDELRDRVATGEQATLGLSFPAPDVVEDNLYPQLRKAETSIARVLGEAGFDVGRSGHYADGSCLLLWEVAPPRLPATREHRGPPVDRDDHVERFRAKWEDHPDAAGPVREVDGRVVVDVERDERDPDAVARARLDKASLGAHVEAPIRGEGRFLVGEALVTQDRAEWLSRFFDDVPPWERARDG